MKLPHWLQLVLALAVVILAWVMQQASSGALVLPAAVMSALTVLSTVLGLFTRPVGQVAVQDGKVSLSRPPPGQRGCAPVRLVAALAVVGLFALVVGCPALVPVVGPSIDTGVCAVEEALKGKTLLEIWNDCKGDLAKIIEALLNSTDPQVRASAAFRDAVRARAALQADKCQ
jgi:hypothetical protein